MIGIASANRVELVNRQAGLPREFPREMGLAAAGRADDRYSSWLSFSGSGIGHGGLIDAIRTPITLFGNARAHIPACAGAGRGPYSRTMIVELFGIPGAGKSTLVKRAAERASFRTRHDVTASWKGRPLIERTRALLAGHADLRLVLRVARLAAAARISDSDSLRRSLRIIAKSERLRRERGLVVLDQGLLQELWSMLYASGCYDPDPARLSAAIKSLYGGIEARIVFIEVDSATASARVAQRAHGHSRLDGLPDHQIGEQLELAAELPRRIVKAARTAGLDVRRIDGGAPIEARVIALLGAAAE